MWRHDLLVGFLFGYHRVPRNQVELDLWVVPEQLHLLRAGSHRFHAARQSWGGSPATM